MSQSYEYSVGSVRAREKHLLTNADIETMLSFKNTDSLVSFLRDKGYGEGNTVGEILRSSRQQTMEYLFSVVPDPSVFDVFFVTNDAHNIKSVIKGVLADTSYSQLFVEPCTIELETIETAVKENKYSLLPEEFSLACSKAYEVLAHTADARLADAYIDSASMLLQLKKASQTGIDFLIDYFNTDIFYRNVKIALRACLTGAPADYYEIALCGDVPLFNKKEVTTAALKGMDSLLSYLSVKSFYKCSEAIEQYRVSPAGFERYVENLLMRLTKESCKVASSGAYAAIGFYLARLTEEKTVHIIAVGINTNADPSVTRERLREIYG